MKLKSLIWSLSGVCLLGLSACRKDPPPPAAPPPTANKVSVADSGPGTDAPPPPSANATAPAEANIPEGPDFAAAARILTKGLKDYVAKNGKMPRNLDEIKAAGFIQTIPEPPPSMRWDLDPKKIEVTAAGYAVGF
jgi:hypothetical protein